MIKLVIIDFDDTLSLTEQTSFEIENHIADLLGFSPMNREAHLKNWGTPLKEAIVDRIPGINPDKFMEIFQQVLPGFLNSGKVDVISSRNIKTLKALKDSGKKLAVLTSRSYHEAKHLLDKNHHLNNWIDKIYHADNSKYLKPDPKVFTQILDHFQVNPREAVYIGDSIGDGVGAKGAGIHFIAVLESGLRTRADFDSVSVDFFADTFAGITSYIETH